jgi:predicted lipoprotein with Yx(FWY)xxD motif
MMSNDSGSSVPRVSWFAGAAVAVALLASACASSSTANSGGTSAANPAGGAGGSSSAAASGIKIETHSGPMGTYLTDGSGKSLYMFASDSATKSSCNGACVAYWPPLTGTAQASGGASAAKVTTITRSDGTMQVVYAGHPLYYYKGDSAPGDTNGQGSDNYGAKWWLLTAAGAPITGSASAPGSGSASSSSAGGGGGGWS